MVQKGFSEINDENKIEITISIINTGQEIYKKEEINWEIFVPFDYLQEKDITKINGDVEICEEVIGKIWKFYGINQSPLFLEQTLHIAKLNFKIETLEGTNNVPLKIYYRFWTINGNIPTIDHITKDFMGEGIPIERYPKLGELIFDDWYNPGDFHG